MKGGVKVAVMKGGATCADVLACSRYDTKKVNLIPTVDDNVE